MKNFTKTITNKTLFKPTRWLIMALMLLLGTGSAWAQNYNYHWKGKVYFLVPEQWDLDQYGNIQVDITRTTDPTEYNYQTYTNISQTTRIGTSRLYYINLDINHSDWKQNEYIAFTANSSSYNSGSFNLNGNHYYTIPIDYDCNNELNYYLFIPTDVSQFTTTGNGNTIKGVWSDNRNILKAAQTVNIYTNEKASNSGGSIKLTGYYFNDSDTEIKQSTANSSGTSGKYEGAVIGSAMTLTASTNTGYEFDGWYTEASGGTLLSSSATYTYNVYETKTIYARFTQSCTPPDEPIFDAIPAQCGSYTLPTEDINKVKVNWYNANGNEITSVTQSGTYYAEAVDGTCVSENRTDVEITINTKPTISISGNPTAVLYEDVTLTAEATEAKTINWSITSGDGKLSATTGTSVVLTSSTAGTVTVTATATSEADCTSAATKTVIFDAENCNSTTTTVTTEVIDEDKMEIWCREETGSNAGANLECYAWDNNQTLIFGSWNGKTTSSTKTYGGKTYRVWEINNISSEYTLPIKVIFSYQEGNSTYQTDDLETGVAGHKYTYWFKKDGNGNSNKGKKETVFEKGDDYDDSEIKKTITTTTTIPAPITSPAAKTISVSSTEGGGNIIFSGQVVKTGCADALTYGFAYSTDANADKNNWTKVECANTGNTAGIQYNGEKTGIEVDGTYYVCAYITNSAGTSYGAVTEITVSTQKTLITSVTLTHVKDVNGTAYEDQELENLIYCVGDEVWFELNYKGSTFIPENNVGFKWTTYPGNGLKGPYNGNKYKFTITGSGTIGISLRNEANVDGEGNPTWVESDLLQFNTHTEPAVPYISIYPVSGIICEGSSATITVENANPNCSYKLVEEEEDPEAGFTQYVSGDLKYTVQDVAKYYVVAQHKACTNNEYTSNKVEINQIISTSATISIEPDEEVTTTPWEPVTITVIPQEGYVYELSYTGNNLASVDGVIIKQNGDSYTYYIPRPDSWSTGDATPVRTAVEYGIKAQLKVDGEASECTLKNATAIIHLKDEDNEDCE